MTWFGWDGSDFDWQRGPMDIGAAARDGVSFFTHKATEGTKVIHRNYRLALERARDAGMPVYGAYFVPRTPGNNGHGSIAQQVAFFVAYLDSETPWWRADPRFRILQVDTEHWSDSNGVVYDAVAPRYGAQACALLSGYGKYVPHYAPAWAYGDGIPGADPLWASNYGNNPAVHYRQAYPGDDSSAWAPYSGRVPAIIQYGAKLTIGSQSTCDANAIKDPAVWSALTGGSAIGQALTGGQSMIQVKYGGTIVLTNLANWHDRLPYGTLEMYRLAGMPRWDVSEAEMIRILALPQSPLPVAGQAVTVSASQLAELKAGLPTTADIVTELLNRIPRA